MSNGDLFNTHRATSPLSTKWLWFYVKVGLIFEMFRIISGAGQFAYAYRTILNQDTLVLLMLLQACFIGPVIWIYIEMKRFTKRSFTLNRVLLLLEGLTFVLNTIGSGLRGSIFIRLILASAWVILNWIYFDKRKDLFCNPKLLVTN